MDNLAATIARYRASGLPFETAGPAPEAAIRQLEARCGYELPPSYRAFLERIGSLSFHGRHIAGVVAGRIDTGPSCAWYVTELVRGQFELPPDVLVIEWGVYDPACLDFGRRRPDGEVPVARFDPHTGVSLTTDPSFGVWLPAWVREAVIEAEG